MQDATIQLEGNLGADPELRYTANGKAVCDMRIAHTPRRKDAGGEWVDGDTTWYAVTVWSTMAESCAERLNKGDRVTVNGRLTFDTYTSKQTGMEVTAPKITATTIGVVPPILKHEAPQRKPQYAPATTQAQAPRTEAWPEPTAEGMPF